MTGVFIAMITNGHPAITDPTAKGTVMCFMLSIFALIPQVTVEVPLEPPVVIHTAVVSAIAEFFWVICFLGGRKNILMSKPD